MPDSALIVIPTFNEAESIERLLGAIRAVLPSAHVLVVDDASPDGTAALVRRLAQADARVHLCERAAKLGIGSAYVAGFAWGLERRYSRFFQMDADFSHDPKFLAAFMTALDAGADVVVGSRSVSGGGVEGWGLLRHALSKGGSLYARLALGGAVRDMTTGFKGYARSALERLELSTLRSNGYAFQIETTYRALCLGLRVVEVPIWFVDRRAGQSKMTRAEVFEAVAGVWLMRGGGRRSRL